MENKFLILNTIAETQALVDTINNDLTYTGKGTINYVKVISHTDGRGAVLTCDNCHEFMTVEQITSLKTGEEMAAAGWLEEWF